MRPSPSASLTAWPTRIFRPWLVASAAGFTLGLLLLRIETAPPAAADSGPVDFSPRAAVAEPTPMLAPDPFAPASALAAPPDPAPLEHDARPSPPVGPSAP